MPTYSYSITAQPIVRLYGCDGDISILGVDSTTIDLSTGADDLDEQITQTDTELRLEHVEERLTLRVPRGTQIEIQQQSGDVNIQDVASARLTDISGDVKLRSISGDINLDSIEGDLTIDRAGAIAGHYIGGDARCTSATRLRIDEIAGDTRIIDIPTVQIEQIGGDAHIVGAQEQCRLGAIEGDLRIRNAQDVDVRTVAGDCTMEQIGALECRAIEGDCTISSDSGAVIVKSIAGDLSARVQQGPLNVTHIGGDARIEGVSAGLELGTIGGDLDLRLEPTDGATYQAHVGSDAQISLPANCNLTIKAQVEGSISGMSTSRGRRHNAALNAVLGNGAAELMLAVDGDLALRGAALRSQIQILQPARPAEAPPAPRAYVPATGATVRLAAEPVRRARPAGSSDEERLALLRMLAEGRLSIEEADQLLNAVDQRGSSEQRPAATPPAVRAEAVDPLAGFTVRQRQVFEDHGVDSQYITALQQLGLTDLVPEQLIALKDHDVEPELVQALQARGMAALTPEQLIELADEGVTAAFVAKLPHTNGDELTPEQLIELVQDQG